MAITTIKETSIIKESLVSKSLWTPKGERFFWKIWERVFHRPDMDLLNMKSGSAKNAPKYLGNKRRTLTER